MEIIRPLTEKTTEPTVLTIGNFDGVHLGHQKILKHVKEVSAQKNAKSCVLTFENHPSTILRPEEPIPLLCSLKHRLKLIEEQGIDRVILLPFTKELSEYSAETFLKKIQEMLPLTDLILGYDSTIGKAREGDQNTVKALAQTLHFSVEYVAEEKLGDMVISSSAIRSFLQKGDLQMVKNLLGRSFSFYGLAISRQGIAYIIGYPSAKLEINGLCLPPLGIYAVSILENNNALPGLAVVGVAPTMRKVDSPPFLEVFLFESKKHLFQQERLSGKNIEVIPIQFIRQEIKFPSLHDWQNQFIKDIENAKEILNSYNNKIKK